MAYKNGTKPRTIFNQAKHGINFADIERFDWDHAVSIPSDRYGETRIAPIGNLDGLLHFVVYTIRELNRRIISLRRASDKERELYDRLS